MRPSVLVAALAVTPALAEAQDLVTGASEQMVAWGLSPETVQQQVNAIDWRDVSGAAVTTLTAIATNTWAVLGLLLTVVMWIVALAGALAPMLLVVFGSESMVNLAMVSPVVTLPLMVVMLLLVPLQRLAPRNR